jgi:Tfp pilus assembly protein PilF
LVGALKMQRENYKEAKYYFDEVLDADWTHSHANLLMGIFYKLVDWSDMSRKHFAIAKVKRMRDLGVLPPKSS